MELKLKQASAVLGLLLQATVALYLKKSLGASTSYLTKFADAVAQLPEFETRTPAIVRLRASAWKGDPPVEIRIPLGALAAELRRRLPLADVARDLPPGRKRLGWKRDFLASVRAAAADLKDVSDKQITDTVNAYRRRGRFDRDARANPGSLDPASPPSSPQVVYFPSGDWPTS